MKILVLGGTRFFGVHLVCALLEDGHEVTIATRGRTPDSFGSQVSRIVVDRLNAAVMKMPLQAVPMMWCATIWPIALMM